MQQFGIFGYDQQITTQTTENRLQLNPADLRAEHFRLVQEKSAIIHTIDKISPGPAPLGDHYQPDQPDRGDFFANELALGRLWPAL